MDLYGFQQPEYYHADIEPQNQEEILTDPSLARGH